MKRFILLILTAFAISSCSKKDSDLNANPIEGEWNLVSVYCECAPINLEIGRHIWIFDIDNNEISVQNNVTEQLHTIPETGTYQFNVSNNTIIFNGVEYEYHFENDKLYLDSNLRGLIDAPIFEFVKN